MILITPVHRRHWQKFFFNFYTPWEVSALQSIPTHGRGGGGGRKNYLGWAGFRTGRAIRLLVKLFGQIIRKKVLEADAIRFF